MESGWVINYQGGKRLIVNETAYALMRDEGEVESEMHWFSLDEAIAQNPGVEILVMKNLTKDMEGGRSGARKGIPAPTRKWV